MLKSRIAKEFAKAEFNSEYQKKLVQGLAKYGFDPKTIKKEYKLQTDTFTIGKQLLLLNPNLNPEFTIQQDLQILEKVKNKSPTWLQLAFRLNKSFKQVHYRYEQYLRKHIQQQDLPLQEAIDKTIPLIEQDSLESKEWTDEMDKKLLVLGRKLKCQFSLLVHDFPFSTQQIRQRYELLVDKEKLPFFPKHDKLVIECTDFTKLHLENLQQFSPARLRRRQQYLLKNPRLESKDVASISKLVEKYGKAYYKFTDIKDARVQWAVYEPSDQRNAIWTSEKDDHVLQKHYSSPLLKGHLKIELDTRHYYLLDKLLS